MILIFADDTSTRLQYSCKFIFEEALGLPFNISLHEKSFADFDGMKISYSSKSFENAYRIIPARLLFEKDIFESEISVKGSGDACMLFKNESGDHPFDIFAAIFYLISRYEEYLPHRKDVYGRFAHENSLAFKHDFLDIPLVNIWLKRLAAALTRFNDDHHFPALFAPGTSVFYQRMILILPGHIRRKDG